MTQLVTGLHHVTALASDPQKTVNFYAGILGLRLVKKTINFDAPEIYYLYFGNEKGSPGTILTFFPYSNIPKGRKGKGQLTVTSFSISENAMDYWIKRLSQFNVPFKGPEERFDEKGNRFRYSASGKPGDFVDVLCTPEELKGQAGYGTVHHVAFATKDDSTQLEARAKLVKFGLNVTPVIDREYFHSIYFREPGGILFEIATLPPGFAIDEPLESLGSSLKLPPWEEPNRALIEKILPPIHLNDRNYADQ